MRVDRWWPLSGWLTASGQVCCQPSTSEPEAVINLCMPWEAGHTPCWEGYKGITARKNCHSCFFLLLLWQSQPNCFAISSIAVLRSCISSIMAPTPHSRPFFPACGGTALVSSHSLEKAIKVLHNSTTPDSLLFRESLAGETTLR